MAIVYEESIEVPSYNITTGVKKRVILTYIESFPRKKFSWRKFRFVEKTYYQIKQFVPYIAKPFYDGEHSTNTLLSSVAQEQYFLAELWIKKNMEV